METANIHHGIIHLTNEVQGKEMRNHKDFKLKRNTFAIFSLISMLVAIAWIINVFQCVQDYTLGKLIGSVFPPAALITVWF